MIEPGFPEEEVETAPATEPPPPRRRPWRPAMAAGLLAAVAAAATLTLVAPGKAPRPPAARVETAAAPAETAVALRPAGRDWSAIDRQVAQVLLTARLQQAAVLQRRAAALAASMRSRVGRDFLPWYLSFGRRKLEELHAYNLYARDRVVEWLTGERQQSAQMTMLTTFENEFGRQVLRPEETRRNLLRIGQDIADGYAERVAAGLHEIQDGAGISFADWQAYLAKRQQLSFVGADGRRRDMPAESLVAPDPVWLDLAGAIGAAAIARFERAPSIVDAAALVDKRGRSIFTAGENAAVYFGSYLVYWLGLIILIRSGVIPFSLFGFLLGWLLWESFVWGSWIGYEYLDFEQTRASLSPVIETRADAYIAQLQAMFADGSRSGPLRVLYQLEESLPSG